MGTRRVVVWGSSLLVGTVALVGAARLAAAVAPGSGTAPSAVAGAPALSLTVDSPIDAVDASPGDGVCDDGTGHCTLRAAVEEVDRRGSARTSVITLATDPVLSIAPTGADDNSSGDLNIRARLEIHGNKHLIRGSGHDRIIHHEGGKLSLVKVVLTGGLLDQSDQGQGGAIWTDGELSVLGSKLTLNRVTGSAVEGGAIYAGPSSTLFIGTSQLRDNAANALAGWSISGGAVSAHGHVTIVQSLLSGNGAFAVLNGAGQGGGLAASGPETTITQSTISDNRAGTDGGGLALGPGRVALTGSAVTGNRANGVGGGVSVAGADLTATDVTVSGNRAGRGGVAVDVSGGSGSLAASTVAANQFDFGGYPPVASLSGSGLTLTGTIVDSPYLGACAEPVTSDGWNLASDSSCELSQDSDHEAVAVELGALGDHGGPTATHLAAATSPAVDVIPPGTPGLCDGSTADQRGTGRPQGAGCDAGAVEGTGPALAPLALVVDSSSDAPDTAVGDGTCRDASGHCTLRAAIQETNARPTADTITMAQPYTITRSGGGLLMVTDHLTIHGAGSTVDAAFGGSVLIQTGAVLNLDHLTLRRGDNLATGPVLYQFWGKGGGIGSSGDLHLADSALTDNGGGYVSEGTAIYHVGNTTMTVDRTSFLRNRGDVVSAYWGRTTIDASTMAQNVGTGLTVRYGTVSLTNSSIVDNVVDGPFGVALSAFDGDLSLVADTIAGNGNIIGNHTGQVTTKGSILQGSGGVLSPCWQAITSLGHNTANDTSCGLTDPTDQEGVDVPLGALTDNGGPTLTRLAEAGSAAIDAIPIGTPGLCDADQVADQRGIARPQGPACDIGATEGSTDQVGALSLTVDSAADRRDATPGDGICDDGSGHCTLRAAFDEADRADTDDVITIAPGIDPVLSLPYSYDQFNVGDDLDAVGPLTIHGNGATIDASGIDQVIDQHQGPLHLDHLTVTGGSGGAIRAAGALGLDHVTVTRNVTGDEPTVAAASAEVVDSTISYNSADGQFEHGALVVTGPLDLVRSTVDHNRSNSATVRGVDMTIVDSTITDNVAISTNWITSYDRTAVLALGTKTTISNSTIAANAAPTAVSGAATVRGSIVDDPGGVACSGQITSIGHNLVSDTSCGPPAAGDQFGVSPRLGTLADHGGPTRTRLPLADSPAVDAVPTGTADLCDGSVATDQRGIARPQGPACDIGAVEGAGTATSTPLSLTVDVGTDTTDAAIGDGACDDGTGHCSLRAAVQETNAAITDDVVTIAPGVDPTLSRPPTEGSFDQDGDLDVLGGLVIHGDGATLDAAHLDRAFRLSAGTVRIDDLTIVHGRGGGRGGALVADGPLTLEQVTVRDSEVSSLGNYIGSGGGIATFGPLTLTRSVVEDNVTDGDGGGIYVAGTATISDSTVAGNQATASYSSGGGIAGAGSDVTVDRSTISGNGAAYGGGIFARSSVVTLARSTVSGNVVTQSGSFTASAVWAPQGSIVASTVVGNVTPAGTSAVGGYGLTLRGSIVSDAVAACAVGQVVDPAFDLVSDGTCGVPAAPADLLLGALADNGGPTLTILPGTGSPAIDAIPAGTAGLCDGTYATDQRGAVRPHGSACDIGSVER